MTAFLEFDAVWDWLVARGLGESLGDWKSTKREGALLGYLPSRLTIDLDPGLVAGALGESARGGFVAFSLYSGSTAASWNVVMDLTGALHQVAPTRYDAPASAVHACALKNWDEDTLLVGVSANKSAKGHAFKWDWRRDAYARIGGDAEYGCHDINWSADPAAADAVWITGSSYDACGRASKNANVSLVDAATGAARGPGTVASGYGLCEADVNHAQLLDGDTSALFSLRLADAVSKVATRDGGAARAWTIGGEHGEWPIEDLARGVTYPPGATVWKGQHNAEYMGEDEVWMFDNLGLGNESRMLIVALNESARTARLVWEHRLGALANVYGDCDPTPAGNVLGSYWRRAYGNATPANEVQAGVVEVSRATGEVAWDLRIYGRACPDGECASWMNGEDALRSTSWMMFSVERFYEAPVLPSPGSALGAPACKRGGLGGSAAGALLLQFTVFDSFKRNGPTPGRFELAERGGGANAAGRVVVNGTFEFKPHWRPTLVSAAVELQSSDRAVPVRLTVSNARGRAVRYDFECVR